MLKIIGGAKTGYNLYSYCLGNRVEAELSFFPKEYSSKRRMGKPFYENIFQDGPSHQFIITSETAFQAISEFDRTFFSNHYFLRNKDNLSLIAQAIRAGSIEEISFNQVSSFPVIIKPKESAGGNVPFKFRILNNRQDLASVSDYVPYCVIQPYLGPNTYRQIAIAGYYDGVADSLIAVEQVSQYPQGVSAYVVDMTAQLIPQINSVSCYLNGIGFRGFIEMEFKQNRIYNELYLMDVNPRPWGWFYYYLARMENFKQAIVEDEKVQLNNKKAWVNLPRLAMANFKGNLRIPNLGWALEGEMIYEPCF